MNVRHPANELALQYLSSERFDVPVFMARELHPDPYLRAGCHPDIVERIWDQIGPAHPFDCRCLIYGFPALAIPVNGIIIGLGLGTQYGLRLPGQMGGQAIGAGAQTITKWGAGQVMDIREAIGPEWLFGCWKEEELDWCKLTIEQLKSAA